MTAETFVLRELLASRRDEFQLLLDRYGATNPKLFGSVACGTAHPGSDIDILVVIDPSRGNLLMRASGLMEETRELFGRDDVDVLPAQLLKWHIQRGRVNDVPNPCCGCVIDRGRRQGFSRDRRPRFRRASIASLPNLPRLR